MAKRLIDLEVDEISAVDKAANKREFLVIKQDGFQTEGRNQMGFHTGAEVGEVDATADEAWNQVLNRLNALVAADYTGRSREQIFAAALGSDTTLRELYAAWGRVRSAPAEATAEKRAKELVEKGAAPSYAQAYARVLNDDPALYGQITTEAVAARTKTPLRKAGAKSLRDVIGDKIDSIVAAEKATNPKVTYYVALSEGLKKRGLSDLYEFYADANAALPVDLAVEKLAKKYGIPAVEIAKKLQ